MVGAAFWVVGIAVWFIAGNAIGGVGGFFGGGLLGVVAGAFSAYVVDSVEQSNLRAAAELAKREANAQQHRVQQAEYKEEIGQLSEQALVLFERAPTHLTAAEDQLDQAERDYAEGVFAPFWDSIERAANSLGRFDGEVRAINDASSRFTALVKVYEATVPHFPLSSNSVGKLAAGTGTAERMKGIVRRAQRDFHFSTIYEQRKTNQILVAGFTNLAQALDQMTWRITSSINDLSSAVQTMGTTLNESIRAVDSRLGDIQQMSAQRYDNVVSHERERSQREEKVIAMLDNIQRSRKPVL